MLLLQLLVVAAVSADVVAVVLAAVDVVAAVDFRLVADAFLEQLGFFTASLNCRRFSNPLKNYSPQPSYSPLGSSSGRSSSATS